MCDLEGIGEVGLSGGTGGTPVPLKKRAPASGQSQSGDVSPRSKQAARGGARGAAGDAGLVNAAGALLKEPFRAADIMQGARCDNKAALAAIARWEYKGWIKRVSRGEFARTEKFGGGKAMVFRAKPKPQKGNGEKLLEEIHAEIDAAKPKDED